MPGVEPVVARIQGLLVGPSVRAMLGQTESTIDLGRILDGHGILLVDIAKGRIGEDVSVLLGSFMVARLWQITQRRDGTPEERRRPAVVVADEFQNFVDGGDKLTEILTESRAYRSDGSSLTRSVTKSRSPSGTPSRAARSRRSSSTVRTAADSTGRPSRGA